MVDINVHGNIEKFYAFLAPQAKTIGEMKKCEGLPNSVFQSSALLESWGFRRFAIFGVNLQNNSFNFYYYTDPAEFNRDKIKLILSTLGFTMPSETPLKKGGTFQLHAHIVR